MKFPSIALNFLCPIPPPPSHTASFCPVKHLPLTALMQCTHGLGTGKSKINIIFHFSPLVFWPVGKILVLLRKCLLWESLSQSLGRGEGEGDTVLFFTPANPPSPPLTHPFFFHSLSDALPSKPVMWSQTVQCDQWVSRHRIQNQSYHKHSQNIPSPPYPLHTPTPFTPLPPSHPHPLQTDIRMQHKNENDSQIAKHISPAQPGQT